MNFRNSDCVTVCVDYVEMVLVQCVPNTLFLSLAPVLVELRVLSMYSSTSTYVGSQIYRVTPFTDSPHVTS